VGIARLCFQRPVKVSLGNVLNIVETTSSSTSNEHASHIMFNSLTRTVIDIVAKEIDLTLRTITFKAKRISSKVLERIEEMRSSYAFPNFIMGLRPTSPIRFSYEETSKIIGQKKSPSL
jgi:hypothetical protein